MWSNDCIFKLKTVERLIVTNKIYLMGVIWAISLRVVNNGFIRLRIVLQTEFYKLFNF